MIYRRDETGITLWVGSDFKGRIFTNEPIMESYCRESDCVALYMSRAQIVLMFDPIRDAWEDEE